jgi:hypothetical protein
MSWIRNTAGHPTCFFLLFTFCLLFLLDDRRIRIREAQKHGTDHPDPDPQHWPVLFSVLLYVTGC